MDVKGKQIMISVRMLALIALAVVLAGNAFLCLKYHTHNMSLWHQKDKDFPYDVRYSKLTQPLALVSTGNHFMLLAPKGKLILYCSGEGCIGAGKKELQETITELFQDLANQNRAAQQKPATINRGPSLAAPAAPGTHFPKGAKK